MLRTVLLIFVIGPLAGCLGGGQVEYRGSVGVTAPDMLVISPGVRVIADYDEPIFYADSYYWMFSSGGWYRSSVYTGGWVYVASPPAHIRRIDRPHAYVHYRPSGYVPRHRPVPARQVRRPTPVRDHRSTPVVRDHRSTPVVRDHRPTPVVRDHRPTPVVRDHHPSPMVRDRRDHRPTPVVRDQRDRRATPTPRHDARAPAKTNKRPEKARTNNNTKGRDRRERDQHKRDHVD